MKIESIRIVRFDDLDNVDIWFDNDYQFSDVSYGDATMTLINKYILIDEIENKDDKKLVPLIDEVNALPNDVLIALDG